MVQGYVTVIGRDPQLLRAGALIIALTALPEGHLAVSPYFTDAVEAVLSLLYEGTRELQR